VLSNEALKAKLAARGLPERVARISLGLYEASRRGEFAAVDPTLERLLGRNPLRVRDLLAEKLRSSKP